MDLESTHYMVWVEGPDYWAVYMHVARGSGRARRRHPTGVYRFPKPKSGATAPDLVRLLAREMERQWDLTIDGVEDAPAPPGGPRGEGSTLT